MIRSRCTAFQILPNIAKDALCSSSDINTSSKSIRKDLNQKAFILRTFIKVIDIVNVSRVIHLVSTTHNLP